VGVVRFSARGVSGYIRFTEEDNGVRIEANLQGLRGMFGCSQSLGGVIYRGLVPVCVSSYPPPWVYAKLLINTLLARCDYSVNTLIRRSYKLVYRLLIACPSHSN